MAQWLPHRVLRPGFFIAHPLTTVIIGAHDGVSNSERKKCAGLRPTVCALLGVVALTTACGNSTSGEQAGSGRIADVASSVAASSVQAHGAPLLSGQPGSGAVESLTRAAGGVDGARYTARGTGSSATITGGMVVGRIGGGERASRDSIIVPTHDHAACEPFTQRALPSAADGVGNAVVWLVGVASGPADTSSRRSALRLAGCRLEPRVQRVPVGGTIMLSSKDAMMTRLRFVDVGGDGTPRATVLFNDAGQVVPTSDAAARGGLVEVRDDLHPWVRAYIAVAPHPFVAVTEADGLFRFDGVPAGRYTLVVWSEVLGTRTRELTVTSGVETRIDIKY